MKTNKLIGFAKKNNLTRENSVKKTNIKHILNRSTRATCGVTEREVIAPVGKAASHIKALRKAGFFVVGTSMDKPKKIWFIRRGGL